jgi:Zn-dependent peptidase ImmA (M78 family)/DNA-binding XRE family transcriptional regulator
VVDYKGVKEMARRSPEVMINPKVLKALRESSRFTIEEIAEKLSIKPETYSEFELGKRNLTLKRLEELSHYFKRPLSAFFLKEPPKELPLSASFRILPKAPQRLSKEFYLAVRRARNLQNVAHNLAEELGERIEPDVVYLNLADDPKEAAKRERERLKIEIATQLKAKAFEWYRILRDRLEERRILSFQMKMPISDARGFLLMDTPPYAIVTNSADNIYARIFTLLHEYAHILLKISEVYSPQEDLSSDVERWCSTFASEFLLPEDEMKKDPDIDRYIKTPFSLDTLKAVSNRFKLSRHAILLRLLMSKTISKEIYQAGVDRLYREEIEERRFGLPPHKKCLVERGRFFVSLILQAEERRAITYGDVADYLSLKLKHLDSLKRSLYGE